MQKQFNFPKFRGTRCLMMPYIQGDLKSVPEKYHSYTDAIENVFIKKGDIGHLTIDEKFVKVGKAHRASRAKFERAIHTEAGRHPDKLYAWGGGGGWGSSHRTLLDPDTQIILANNIDDTCAVWDAEEENTSLDGDIGHLADNYPMQDAKLMKAGELKQIGILTPHESIPLKTSSNRQFLRIIGKGVHGREAHFTVNPLMIN